MAERNGNTTITQTSKVSVGLLLAGLALVLGVLSWQVTFLVDVKAALPRQEAMERYVTRTEYNQRQEELLNAIREFQSDVKENNRLILRHMEKGGD